MLYHSMIKFGWYFEVYLYIEFMELKMYKNVTASPTFMQQKERNENHARLLIIITTEWYWIK